jgi:hypothetical protein
MSVIAGIAITGAFIIAATYLFGDGIWPHDSDKPTLSWRPEMSEADWEQAQMMQEGNPPQTDRRYAFRDVIGR